MYARDSRASLILLSVCVGMIFGIRKLGYLEYLAADKFIGWFKDLSDDIGLKHDRRSFLSLQVAFSGSRDLEEIWNKTLDAAQFLGMEYVKMKLFEQKTDSSKNRRAEWEFRSGRLDSDMLNLDHVMHLILPLASKEHQFGSLALAKDFFVSPLTPFTLRRVEQLRRTLVDTLQNRAHEAARESVKKLTRFMESSPDGFFLLDSQLNFIDINESGLKYLGMTKEEILAKNLQDVLPDIKETGRYYRYLEVIKTAKPFFTHDIISDSRLGEICLPVKAFKVADALGIVIQLPIFGMKNSPSPSLFSA